ncbi:hypothetical protein G4O51_00870 [Candidatus Bathyarchaeota archaeon A05DMB-2]|jgi:hypothetical protein|nr:hypothetical protein [Candidatus Bathyarchaeota archaeon A05DMB-2]
MNKTVAIKSIVFATILLASIRVVGGYTLQWKSQSLEVREPLEVLPSNSVLSLFPGETLRFNVTVENHASISYNVCLIFRLNDTYYQERYVSFSNCAYTIEPGAQTLDAWLSVSSAAPAAELELIVNITRDIEPTPAPSPPSNLAPSLTLFGAGARWAAGNGTSALYINWYDNYVAHHFSDGADWGPYWRERQLGEIKNVTVDVLEQQGFAVTCVGDIPSDISGFDLVVFEAWFAIEPQHSQVVMNYLAGGGNVVIIGGAPCYFATYCKDMWPYVSGGENLSAISDWFGSAQFVNSGGTASLVVDKPFGTSLEARSTVYHIDAYGCYSLAAMSENAQVIARWGNGTGSVYAFAYEYGNGRVYYQAEMDW